MVLGAATLWAANGTVAKVILQSGDLSSQRLAEVRSTGAFVGLALIVALVRPSSLRVTRGELPFLLAFGVLGLALVQWTYFGAIERLDIGIALLIQYTAPLMIALWARFAMREHVRARIWAALVLALFGLGLVVDFWRGLSLDGVGVLFALGAALSFALYILLAERGVVWRDPVSLLCLGMLFSSVFWSAVQPWWRFPTEIVDDDVSLLGNLGDFSAPVWLLMAWVIVFGTIVPFALLVGSLRHLPATRVGIAAMFEPVAATIVAYLWLDESLSGLQLIGAALVLAGILLAQTARDQGTVYGADPQDVRAKAGTAGTAERAKRARPPSGAAESAP
jgi:drug/metabolite transporter (DMT)-like permease